MLHLLLNKLACSSKMDVFYVAASFSKSLFSKTHKKNFNSIQPSSPRAIINISDPVININVLISPILYSLPLSVMTRLLNTHSKY